MSDLDEALEKAGNDNLCGTEKRAALATAIEVAQAQAEAAAAKSDFEREKLRVVVLRLRGELERLEDIRRDLYEAGSGWIEGRRHNSRSRSTSTSLQRNAAGIVRRHDRSAAMTCSCRSDGDFRSRFCRAR